MGVGEVRLDGDGPFVRRDGPVRQAPDLQRETQVPVRPGMVRLARNGLSEEVDGKLGLAVPPRHDAEPVERLHGIGPGPQNALVNAYCFRHPAGLVVPPGQGQGLGDADSRGRVGRVGRTGRCPVARPRPVRRGRSVLLIVRQSPCSLKSAGSRAVGGNPGIRPIRGKSYHPARTGAEAFSPVCGTRATPGSPWPAGAGVSAPGGLIRTMPA